MPHLRVWAVIKLPAYDADAITLCNTIPAMVLDIPPQAGVGRGDGWHVWPVVPPDFTSSGLPVSASQDGHPHHRRVGGVSDPVHVAQYLSLGATAVQVGTATLLDFHTPVRIAEGLTKATMEN